MTKIKTGIIGTGFIGPAHVEALRRLGFVEVAAVAERGQELARRRPKLSIPKAYGDYKQMLADPEIQVIHNCTPNHLHFEVNNDILAAKKHIISEKPLAMNSQESRELVRLAKEAGVVHAIDFNYRYMPLVQQAHQMCQAAGDVGRDLRRARHVLAGLAVPGERLELAARARAERRLAGRGRRRQPLVRPHAVHHGHEDRARDGRPGDDPSRSASGRRSRSKPTPARCCGRRRWKTCRSTPRTTPRSCSSSTSGAHGVPHREPMRGRPQEPAVLSKSTAASARSSWDQERPNELWIGRRDGPNETIMKDPSLLYPAAREYAHYPGGHNEGYPDGPKNLFRNVYGFIAGKRQGGDFATFVDGHNEIAICDAVLKSSRKRKWVDVEY